MIPASLSRAASRSSSVLNRLRDLLPGSIENSIEKLEVFGTKSTIAHKFVCFHGYCPKAAWASIGVSLDAEISCVS